MQQYFAALPPDKLAAELQARIDAYYQWILTTGRLARWRTAFNTYYGQRGSHNSSYVQAGGEQGELSFVMDNEYRNLVQHLLVLATQSQSAVQCGAVNTDYRSKAQAILGNGLLEYFFTEGKVRRKIKRALEISLVMDLAWVFTEWDVTLGTAVAADPTTQQMVNSGDVRCRARTGLDVVTDFTRIDPEENDWILVRDPLNKFNLAAQYPEHAEDLVSMQRDVTKDALYRFGETTYFDSANKSSDIDVWTFMHKKSPALPQGRIFQFVSPKVHLLDGPIPYRRIPATRLCPTEMILSSMGYSNANDLLGLQDCIDALISSAVTNATTCGQNNLWTKPGGDTDFEQIANGMNLWESETKPEVIQLNQIQPEVFKLMELLYQRTEAISGVNAVARGNINNKDMSGAAMALLQSMAIQFNSGIQEAWNQAHEDVGTDIIYEIQDFATESRTAMIAGKGKKYLLKEFSQAKIDKIQRVYVQQSNPMKDTISGKLVIAQDMIKMGQVKTADQYLEVLETGNVEAALEDDLTDLLLVQQENEAIADGQTVRALRTDLHHRHIIGHRRPTSDPEARKDQGLIDRMDAHIREHEQIWQKMTLEDPNLLKTLGVPPYLPPPPPPPPPGALPPGPVAQPSGPHGHPPEGPPPPPGPGPGNPAPGAAPGHPPTPNHGGAVGANAPVPAPPPVHAPQAPMNPLTHERWNPQTGGIPG